MTQVFVFAGIHWKSRVCEDCKSRAEKYDRARRISRDNPNGLYGKLATAFGGDSPSKSFELPSGP